jgi:hypothetical protein
MARRVLARRTMTGLMLPDDEQAREELRRVPFNKPVYIEIVSARNPKQHKLVFGGLLKVLVDHGEFPSIDAALLELKYQTGLIDYVVTRQDKDGNPIETRIVPKSISFANMPQAPFQEWFEAAIKVVVSKWLPVASETLRNEIYAALG